MPKNHVTEFSNFANILYSEIGNGKARYLFTKELFKNILVRADKNPLFLDESQGTGKCGLLCNQTNLGNYFSGRKEITEVAQQITVSLDPMIFKDYIGNFDMTIPSIEHLVSSFSKSIPDITVDNYDDKIANYFEQIIRKAAKIKKESEGQFSLFGDDTLNETYGNILVAEAENKCPNDGCSSLLISQKQNGLSFNNYTVVIIDKKKSHTSQSNLIALCSGCANEYQCNPKQANIKRMKEIKKALENNQASQKELAEQKIEESVRSVILKILDIEPVEASAELSYSPVPIRNKIEKKNRVLLRKIQHNVDDYYQAVQSAFKEIPQKRAYENFCFQVRINYNKLYDRGFEQAEIFEKLVDWLKESTNSNREACEIVIAFFVQKCEVFDDIS